MINMTRDEQREFEDREILLEDYRHSPKYKEAFEFLDRYNILPLLKPGTDLLDIDLQLHNAFYAEYNEMHDNQDEDEDDKFVPHYVLQDYIEWRFRIDFEEIYRHSFIVPEEAQKGTRYDTNPLPDISEVE